MKQDTDSFKDYAYRGIDALLKLTAKAGDSIRIASNNAIDKLDSFQLERNLKTLYNRLGQECYKTMIEGREVQASDIRVAALVQEISSISEELARRGTSSTVSE